MTSDAVTLEARKAAEADDTSASAPSGPAGSDRFRQPKVTSLTERRLVHLPPGTRPLPSVSVHDRLLRRGRPGGRPNPEGEVP